MNSMNELAPINSSNNIYQNFKESLDSNEKIFVVYRPESFFKINLLINLILISCILTFSHIYQTFPFFRIIALWISASCIIAFIVYVIILLNDIKYFKLSYTFTDRKLIISRRKSRVIIKYSEILEIIYNNWILNRYFIEVKLKTTNKRAYFGRDKQLIKLIPQDNKLYEKFQILLSKYK